MVLPLLARARITAGHLDAGPVLSLHSAAMSEMEGDL
jgi:hypothetical protein